MDITDITLHYTILNCKMKTLKYIKKNILTSIIHKMYKKYTFSIT